jgi:hypothetical protein
MLILWSLVPMVWQQVHKALIALHQTSVIARDVIF